jgi:hypothetical protein
VSSLLGTEVGGGADAAEVQRREDVWDAQGDPDVALRRRVDLKAALQSLREMGPGGDRAVGADGRGAGGGARGDPRLPGRVAGREALHGERQNQRDEREQRDELDRRLTA